MYAKHGHSPPTFNAEYHLNGDEMLPKTPQHIVWETGGDLGHGPHVVVV